MNVNTQIRIPENNCNRATDIICVGLSFGERHRWLPRREGKKWIAGFRARMRAKGWRVQAPAMAPPYTSKAGMLEAARECSLQPSDSCEDGFAHDNCGGFCIKQGQRRRPEISCVLVRLHACGL